MLDEYNPFLVFHKKFRFARDILAYYNTEEFIIIIIEAKEGDPVQYTFPTTASVCCLRLRLLFETSF